MHISLKNDEEVIWVLWISKLFNIQLSQKYIKLILDTDNWLAIIILLDRISSRKSEASIKKMINKFRNRIIAEYFSEPNSEDNMHTDIWLLAYEADKNKWLNTSGTDTFLFARKHPFFKELRTLGINFYRNDFTYAAIAQPKSKANIYVTRKELIGLIDEYKASFESKHKDESKANGSDKMDEIFYRKIVNVLSNVEDY